MDIIDALKLIIARSDWAANEAMITIRGAQANSPITNQRYTHTLETALRDPGAHFTQEERADLVSCIASDSSQERKTENIVLRLTPTEREHIQTQADQAGQTISDYIRDKIL